MELWRICRDRKILWKFLLLLTAAVGIFLYTSITSQQKDLEMQQYLPEGVTWQTYEMRQAAYVENFGERLQSILDQTDMAGMVSIFQKEDSFSNRNLAATRKAYEKLEGIRPEEGNYEGMEAVLSLGMLDILIYAWGFLLVWAFFEDEKKGLQCMFYATPKGRGKLALQRIFVLAVGNVLFVCSVSLVLFMLQALVYGSPGSLGAAAQSMMLLANYTGHASVGGFLVQYVLVRCFLAFAASLLTWLILSVTRNRVANLGILVLVLGMEWIAFMISSHSSWAMLRYINVIRLVMPGDLLYTYQNFNLFGTPANGFTTLMILAAAVCLAAGCGCVLLMEKRKPLAADSRLSAFVKWICFRMMWIWHGLVSRLSLAGTELYKILFVHKGILFIAVWLYVLFTQMDFTRVEYLGIGAILNEIYSEYTGPDDGRLGEYLSEQQEMLAKLDEEYAEAIRLYEAGEMEEAELFALGMKMEAYMTLRDTLEHVEQQLTYVQKESVRQGRKLWFLQERPYKIMWSGDGLWDGAGYGDQQTRSTADVLLLVFLLCFAFTYDAQCGMLQTVRATALGRQRLFSIKVLLALCVSVCIAAVSFGLEIYEINRNYGLTGLSAPIQSIRMFVDFPLGISIGVFLAGLMLVRMGMLFSLSLITCAVTCRIGGTKGTVTTLILLVVPEALYMIGIGWFRYFSLVQPLLYVEGLNDWGFWPSLIPPAVTALLGLAAYRYLRQYWCGDYDEAGH